MRRILLTLALTLGAQAAQAACSVTEAPVIALDFGSRYADGDDQRATLDTESNKAVNSALRPVDTFVRQLARETGQVLDNPEGSGDRAACAIAAIAVWAEADALSDLQSFNAGLAVGSRLAGIAEAYRLLRPHAPDTVHAARIEAWLKTRAHEQIDFWEIDATSGARNGNLRAWATLAILLAGDIAQDDFSRYWALGATARILCTARPDGSLPQETKRGAYALHYQFHAVAPLVAIAAHGKRQGMDVDGMCNRALARVVDFTLTDWQNGGRAAQTYSGAEQNFFDRAADQKAHLFAWLPAWLSIANDPEAARVRAQFDGLANSKMGGDQAQIWDADTGAAATRGVTTAGALYLPGTRTNFTDTPAFP